MTCTSPIHGYLSKDPNANGNFFFTVSDSEAQKDCPMKIPCRKCQSCRLQYSKEWSIRCTHEMQYHDDNSFLTLTYDPEFLPDNQSIIREHLNLFIKRYRKHLYKNHPDLLIRYFACGEYGSQPNHELTGYDDKLGRPHYHVIIFGHMFDDLTFYKKNHQGDSLYTSDTLTKLWPYGHACLGKANQQTASYVARYIMKKIGGELADNHYAWIDKTTGEYNERIPEFVTMSRMPGIGFNWYQDYKKDLIKGFLTIDGKKTSIPQYYLKLMSQEEDPSPYLAIQELSRRNVDYNDPNYNYERLKARAHIVKKRVSKLKRD